MQTRPICRWLCAAADRARRSISQASASVAQRIYCIAGSKPVARGCGERTPMLRRRVPRQRRRNRGAVDRPRVEDIEAGRSEPGSMYPNTVATGPRDRVYRHVGIIARIQLAQCTTCRQSSPLRTDYPDACCVLPPPDHVHSRVSASINATGTQGVVSPLPTPVALRQGSSRDPGPRASGRACTSHRRPPTIVRLRQPRSLAAHGDTRSAPRPRDR